MEKPPFIHPLADVQSAAIGAGTRVWQFAIVLPGARIGAEVNICSHCFIENDVVVGDRVTIKSGVQLWDGIRIDDDVFVGPNVTFTNDRHPRSKVYDKPFERTVVERGASIGGGAVILQVEKNSIAEVAQLKDSDVILEMAGVPIKATEDVITVVKRQAPGTWLPIKIKRDEHELTIIAKFPPLTSQSR